MSSWLVSIVVTSDDDWLAEIAAAAHADTVAEMAALPSEGDVHTFVSDPVKVTR